MANQSLKSTPLFLTIDSRAILNIADFRINLVSLRVVRDISRRPFTRGVLIALPIYMRCPYRVALIALSLLPTALISAYCQLDGGFYYFNQSSVA